MASRSLGHLWPYRPRCSHALAAAGDHPDHKGGDRDSWSLQTGLAPGLGASNPHSFMLTQWGALFLSIILALAEHRNTEGVGRTQVDVSCPSKGQAVGGKVVTPSMSHRLQRRVESLSGGQDNLAGETSRTAHISVGISCMNIQP